MNHQLGQAEFGIVAAAPLVNTVEDSCLIHQALSLFHY
jgi:hypothetical protein